MKKLIFPVVLAVAAAAMSYLITTWTVTATVRAESGYAAALAATQIKFLRNACILRPIVDSQLRPDLQKYLTEVNSLVGWYLREPAAELAKEYPAQTDPERIIKEMRALAEKEGPKQKAAKGNLPIREECYKLVKGIYDELKGGKYNAVASDYKGSVRLDVHGVTKVEGNKLRWEVVVWGGIGQVVYNGWTLKSLRPATAEEKKDFEKALADFKKDKKAKPEMEPKDPSTLPVWQAQSGGGAPILPSFEGSEYIPDFPPGAEVNYFITPAICPPDADKLEVEFKLKCRAAAGEDQEMLFSFPVPLDSGWRGTNCEGLQKIEATPTYQ